MKYKFIKIMLIPLFALMVFVPVKADYELPYAYWYNDGSQYVIFQASTKSVMALVYTGDKSDVFIYRGSSYNNLAVPVNFGGVVKMYKLESDSWVEASMITYSYGTTVNDNTTYKGYPILGNILFDAVYYNNSYIYNISYVNGVVGLGSLNVSEKKTVLTPAQLRERETVKAVGTMAEKVMGDFGTISVVGGLILGLLLVIPLATRFGQWVKRSII